MRSGVCKSVQVRLVPVVALLANAPEVQDVWRVAAAFRGRQQWLSADLVDLAAAALKRAMPWHQVRRCLGMCTLPAWRGCRLLSARESVPRYARRLVSRQEALIPP